MSTKNRNDFCLNDEKAVKPTQIPNEEIVKCLSR